jgi:hypothetical protein
LAVRRDRAPPGSGGFSGFVLGYAGKSEREEMSETA